MIKLANTPQFLLNGLGCVLSSFFHPLCLIFSFSSIILDPINHNIILSESDDEALASKDNTSTVAVIEEEAAESAHLLEAVSNVEQQVLAAKSAYADLECLSLSSNTLVPVIGNVYVNNVEILGYKYSVD
ncbi:hypothetical protein BDQ17DRAFT_1433216 [Cyathus striatus]|nr:hypothetical protein BDQ17DRAFT_1433216 [Cyathus striatus]